MAVRDGNSGLRGRRVRAGAAAVTAMLTLVGCSPQPSGDTPDQAAAPATPATVAPAGSPPAPAAQDTAASEPVPSESAVVHPPPLGTRRPAWLGTRVLPRTADGFGERQPTPPVLRARRFPTVDILPPPPDGRFSASVSAVPERVRRRSTWSPDCPVTLDDLRYVTVSFWGFDRRPHTGELLVHEHAAGALTKAFRRLYRARYPIEEMRVVDAPELDLPPTGDGNNTTAFVCRPTRGAASWSQHAYGLAIDVNPFFNPYVKGDVVLPELASYFTDRERGHPGMLRPRGPAVRAFGDIGWEWGGSWERPKDWMHFSATGR